jgi:hypothetical protein
LYRRLHQRHFAEAFSGQVEWICHASCLGVQSGIGWPNMAVSGLLPADIALISGVFEKGKDSANIRRNHLF